MTHPDKLLEAKSDDDQEKYKRLLDQPVEDWVFDLWWYWLSIVFRFDSTETQRDVYLAALRERKFTNRDVVYCGRYFEERLRCFPFVSDWLQCPELPRRAGRPNMSRGEFKKSFGAGPLQDY